MLFPILPVVMPSKLIYKRETAFQLLKCACFTIDGKFTGFIKGMGHRLCSSVILLCNIYFFIHDKPGYLLLRIFVYQPRFVLVNFKACMLNFFLNCAKKLVFMLNKYFVVCRKCQIVGVSRIIELVLLRNSKQPIIQNLAKQICYNRRCRCPLWQASFKTC